jgi:outer membrane protein assembly factor BamB
LAGAVCCALLLGACAEPEFILEGERLDLREGSTGNETGRDVPFRAPGQLANAAWTHVGGSPAHEIRNPSLGRAATQVWSVDIGEGNSRGHRITASPVVSEGRVFTLDSRARVSAVSTGGALLWSSDLTPGADRSDDASGGGLAVAGGRVYATTGFGRLSALDAASGSVVWTQDLAAAVSGPPTVLDGRVYVSDRDGRGWAVNTATGEVEWTVDSTPAGSSIVGGAAPAASGSAIVFPFSSGELIAVRPQDGVPLWTAYVLGKRLGTAIALVGDITGDPVISGDRVYAGNQSGTTAAVTLGTGQTVWTADYGAMSPVAVSGGSVFLVSDRNDLVRLDASDGSLIWTVELPLFENERVRRRKDVFSHYGPLLAGDRLIVASSDGVIRNFDPANGQLLYSVELADGAASEPVVAGGTLYVVTDDGTLHAFR